MDGVGVQKVKVITHPKGDLLKLATEKTLGYPIAEAYISHVKFGDFKGWKLHERQVSSLFVLQGVVKFHFDTAGPRETIVLNADEPSFVQIHTNIWFGFEGVSKQTAQILNLSSIEHDPQESKTK